MCNTKTKTVFSSEGCNIVLTKGKKCQIYCPSREVTSTVTIFPCGYSTRLERGVCKNRDFRVGALKPPAPGNKKSKKK